MTLVTQGFMLPSGKPAAYRTIDVYTLEDEFVASGTTDGLGNLVIDLPIGLYVLHVGGVEIPFQVNGGTPGEPGPPGPGITAASQAERTPNAPALTTSPFSYTCPAGLVVQLTVTGGSSVSISVNSGSGLVTFIGGTGTSVLLTPGEIASVAWATVPVIRTRALLKLV